MSLVFTETAFFFMMKFQQLIYQLFPYTTLFRSICLRKIGIITLNGYFNYGNRLQNFALQETLKRYNFEVETDRKSTRLNSSHVSISYAVFCLNKQIILRRSWKSTKK